MIGTAVMVLMIMLCGLCFIEVYRRGFADGQKCKEGKEIEITSVKPKIRTRKEKIRDKRTEGILENINNYNGSGIGQKDIINI